MSYTAQPIETVDAPSAITGVTETIGTPSAVGGVSGVTISAPTALPAVAIPEVEKPCAE